MTSQQISYLVFLFDSGTSISWSPGYGGDREVKSIRTHEDEPGFCAFFDNGKYVALYNEELSNFNVITKNNLAEMFDAQFANTT